MVGIDEAGRGAWAGPLCAAAVYLRVPIAGLKDSKLLNRKQRELLAEEILEKAEVGLGWATPSEIDEFGLTIATTKAMQAALDGITMQADRIIVDGNYNYLPNNLLVENLIKADSLVPAVSAASIVAKVARDKYMTELAKRFSIYQFEKHVGYGTKLHLELLKLHGVCELHRRSYKPVAALLI